MRPLESCIISWQSLTGVFAGLRAPHFVFNLNFISLWPYVGPFVSPYKSRATKKAALPRMEFFTKDLLFMSDDIFKQWSRSFKKCRIKITKKFDFIKLFYSKLMGVWGIYLFKEECIVVLNHAQKRSDQRRDRTHWSINLDFDLIDRFFDAAYNNNHRG